MRFGAPLSLISVLLLSTKLSCAQDWQRQIKECVSSFNAAAYMYKHCNGKFAVSNAMASCSNPNCCTEFLWFSCGATKELLIYFPVFGNPIGLKKHGTSIPMFFLSLHFSYPSIQRGPNCLFHCLVGLGGRLEAYILGMGDTAQMEPNI